MISLTPPVSIITPSYNQAEFIEDTILSVKEQYYPVLEHIVLDGGSTDGTIDILCKYEKKYNLHWISEADEGQSHAINKGFQMAQGEIIGWINSDDTYMAGSITKAVEFLVKNPQFDWVYGDGYWIDENGYVLWRWISEDFDLEKLVCETDYIVQPTVFFRRTIFDKVGYLDTSLHYTMDYDFFIRIGQHFKGKYLPEVLATRRLHLNAKTVDEPEIFGNDAIKTLDKVFASQSLPENIANKKVQAYSNHYAVWGIRCFNAGDYQQARTHLLKSLKISPLPISRRFFAIVLALLQSILGVQWYRFNKRTIKKKRNEFQSIKGSINTNWYSK